MAPFQCGGHHCATADLSWCGATEGDDGAQDHATVFSVLNAVLLKPLAFHEPENLTYGVASRTVGGPLRRLAPAMRATRIAPTEALREE